MMPINSKKILLFDDKIHHTRGCGFDFIENLAPELSKYIQFVSNLNDIAIFQDENCILKIEISDYSFFLFHNILTGTQQALLRETFGEKMIEFSGEGQVEEVNNITSRELIFFRLTEILTYYHYTGLIDSKPFFNPNERLQNGLLDEMIEILILQGKSGFIESKELKIWSQIKGSDIIKLIANLNYLTEEEIVDRIENNWRTQKIIWNI